MAIRKTRSDCRVGNFEKKHGLPPGTIRNRNGRDTRSDTLECAKEEQTVDSISEEVPTKDIWRKPLTKRSYQNNYVTQTQTFIFSIVTAN